jgi:hypothetical protein
LAAGGKIKEKRSRGEKKMVLIGVTVFRDKILNGEKRQTIRLPRKILPKVGETAYLYWKLRTKECEFLKKAKINDVKIRKWKDMKDDLELALADGFDSLFDFRKWFARYVPNDDTKFMIIRWSGVNDPDENGKTRKEWE